MSCSWRSPAQLEWGCDCHPRGPCLPGGVVSHSWSPGPFGSTAQLSGAHFIPGFLVGTSSFLVAQVLVLHLSLVSAEGTLALGAGPLPQATLTRHCQATGWASPAAGVMLCGRRAGGKALTLQNLPLLFPVLLPGSLPSPARSPPAIPDQWAQARGGGPS